MLASASPRRVDLLRSLRFEVRVVPSHYAEAPIEGLMPRELAREHARGKCLDVHARLPSELVVGADTVVDIDGVAYGKPAGAADARRILAALAGRTHAVHTAFAVARDRLLAEECVTTEVRFFALDAAEIAAYVATGEPMDKAGAYGIQGFGATLVERVDGDFYAVMGFPLARFVRTLRQLGIAVPITK